MPNQFQHQELSQMTQINRQIYKQNQRIRNINKTAEQTLSTTNRIGQKLIDQRGVIQNNIEMNKEIKVELKKADKTTNKMIRRNICIKLGLYIIIVLLFITCMALIIWKTQNMNN